MRQVSFKCGHSSDEPNVYRCGRHVHCRICRRASGLKYAQAVRQIEQSWRAKQEEAR